LKIDDKKTGPSPRHKAMDLLARREHSVQELRQKLAVRAFDREEAEQAIQGLIDEGLLSDARFAEAYAVSRLRTGKGPVRIRTELEQRGVAAGLIDASLTRLDVDWCERAREVRVRKYGAVSPDDLRERARQSKFLQYRGFTGEQIRAAFDSADPNDGQSDGQSESQSES
jgi:regulatory protein